MENTDFEERTRPSWDEYFMAMAKLASSRSTCNSRPTGAVIVRDKHVLATGYNGAPPGAPHCLGEFTEDGVPYCHSRYMKADEGSKFDFCRATHAEANAIAQAARMGISIDGAWIYTTLSPCHTCMKLLAGAGLKHIYYERDYDSSDKQRDAYWNEVRKEYGFAVYKRVLLSGNTLDFLLQSLSSVTSERRLMPRSFEKYRANA
ncbi:MAG: dCMP deaminase family protein [Synergistaceae bacterium]|jgi:dCMP deaminase|nr:dCMP deaminase family protein [Synergistaceae bacterium]